MEPMTFENTPIQELPTRIIVPLLIMSLSDGHADIEVLETSNLILFQVSVPPEHAGKLIGKQGTLADALRRVLIGFSGKDNRNYRLEIM